MEEDYGPSIMTDADLDRLSVNTIRTLSMDAVQQANSGHPGTPMAMAPVAYALWQRQLRFDPDDPIWPNRDRFVLSNGHASMLLWSTLHLTGVQAVDADYEQLGKPSVTRFIQRMWMGNSGRGNPRNGATTSVQSSPELVESW